MELKLYKKIPTIINGPRASGKTSLAVKTAKKYGAYASTELAVLKAPYGLSSVLAKEVNTLIIEEFKPTIKNLYYLKELVSSTRLKIDRKGLDCYTIATPYIICCTQKKSAIKIGKSSAIIIIEL